MSIGQKEGKKCKGYPRPDAVLFGEDLPDDVWDAAVRAAEEADVFVTIGTSGVVHPAASLVDIAHASGASNM
eukprot:gnl/Chilomastix_caulleri/1937.p4 GENE.gnl/Chilomastix_caulleri/1937~~gnl/Chilomastix_caulleri/1937.p4  ORF type:complete len:72 (+),score=18.22 gnl/Chilomastix_caulleri/1937:555-770(+)